MQPFFCFLLILMLTSCAGPKVRTTTTARNLTGAEVTTVTETPWVDPFDAALAEAITEVVR